MDSGARKDLPKANFSQSLSWSNFYPTKRIMDDIHKNSGVGPEIRAQRSHFEL